MQICYFPSLSWCRDEGQHAVRCESQTKKEEKETVTEEEEEKFWSAGLFGSGIAKQLLDTIYFYKGKMFGLRGQRKN